MYKNTYIYNCSTVTVRVVVWVFFFLSLWCAHAHSLRSYLFEPAALYDISLIRSNKCEEAKVLELPNNPWLLYTYFKHVYTRTEYWNIKPVSYDGQWNLLNTFSKQLEFVSVCVREAQINRIKTRIQLRTITAGRLKKTAHLYKLQCVYVCAYIYIYTSVCACVWACICFRVNVNAICRWDSRVTERDGATELQSLAALIGTVMWLSMLINFFSQIDILSVQIEWRAR